MTDKLFDDFIKDKLKDYSSAVPADMWDRIAQKKNKEKGGFFWLEYAGAFAVLLCMAIFFGWFGPLDKNSKLSEIKLKVNTHGNSPVFTGLNKENTDENLTEKSETINGEDNSVNSPGSAENRNDDKLSAAGKKKIADLTSHMPKVGAMKSSTKGPESETFLPKKPSSVVSFGKALSVKQQSTDNVEILPFQYHFADRLSLPSVKNKISFESSLNELSARNLKPQIFASVDCPSDRRSGSHGLYLEIFGSPDIAFKNMAYKNTATNNYSARNDSTATKMLSYTLGFRLTKEIGQNMVFKTGLQYSRINEKFDYRNVNERNRTTVVTVRTITNSDGSVITIRDTSIIEQVGYRVKTTYNHYSSLDVPVILGYELAGEGWKANLNGGAIFNISSSQTGEFLDTSYTPVPFSKSPAAVFKRKAGVSLYAGVSLIKNINDRTAFFAEPYFRYSLSDLTAASSPFTSRFHTAGMLLGIRFKLNGSRAAK